MTRVIRKRNKLGQFTKASPWENIVVMRAVKQLSLKLLALMLIVGLNGVALSGIGDTMSYQNDIETSSGNTFIAEQLDFILDANDWSPFSQELDLEQGETVSRDVTTVDIDDLSIDFKYIVAPEKTGGLDAFCDELDLEVLVEGSSVYSGDFLTFVSPILQFSTTTDDITYKITLPSGTPDFANGDFCEFSFIYKGWQDNFPVFPNGFHDIEVVENKISFNKERVICDADTELIRNGGFENPIVTTPQLWNIYPSGTPALEWSVAWLPGPNSFSSLTRPALAQLELQRGYAGLLPFEGQQYAELDADWDGPTGSVTGEPAQTSISQMIPTVSGREYDLSFYFSPRPGTATANDSLEVWINGSLALAVPATVPSSNTNWTLYQHSFTAAGSLTLVEFKDTGRSNNSFGTFLDDVSMKCIPGEEADSHSIVINEFLPNPSGLDNAPKPGGEWVELYNLSGIDVDVAGWNLYDAIDTHELPITSLNTDTGDTIVPAYGWLVVYRNGDGDFSLNNDGDTVRLYDGTVASGTLIDSHTYTEDKPENNSYARIPDGSSNWVDPVPTPGRTNVLTDENQMISASALPIDEVEKDVSEEIVELVAEAATIEEAAPESTEEEVVTPVVEEVEAVEHEEEEEIIPEEVTSPEPEESIVEPVIEPEPVVIPEETPVVIKESAPEEPVPPAEPAVAE